MKHDQHPRFLQQVLKAVEGMAREIAEATSAKNYSISDKPGGSPGYDHVCTLRNGVTVTIRRVSLHQPNEGLQLEICGPDGSSTRVPQHAPFVPWTPEDHELGSLAHDLAPALMTALVDVYSPDAQLTP